MPLTTLEPQDVDDVLLAFPAQVEHLMPAYEDIPDKFKRSGDAWVKFQSDWFFYGLHEPEFTPNKGVDKAKALRHLKAIQGSFEPKHEHKSAAVAYLASLWFKKVRYATVKDPKKADFKVVR